MKVCKAISKVREAVRSFRAQGRSVGLAPTMGALHEGHLTLIRQSIAENDATVVSVFVNPTQFSPGEDYAQYPRAFEQDVALCTQAGVSVVFAPQPEEMYPQGASTFVEVEGVTEGLCGRFRPEHFRGVATVVSKLFNIVGPDRAYFGEKDYQQLVVIRRMVADLNFGLQVVGVPTVREPDGLARSSRNKRLSADERAAAPGLYATLQQAAKAVRCGASGDEAERIVAAELAAGGHFRLQYVEAVDPLLLQRRRGEGKPMVIAVAAFLGNTRLIDNVRIEE